MDFEKRKKNLEDFVIFIENELKENIPTKYLNRNTLEGVITTSTEEL